MTKQTDKIPLYHFTCDHGRLGIARTRMILPNAHPFMRHLGPLIPPTPESVGLQSQWVSCDRLMYRYIVRTRAAVPWAEIRIRAAKEVVATLEEFGQPEHWWVVKRPLTASEFTFDESYTRGGETHAQAPQ